MDAVAKNPWEFGIGYGFGEFCCFGSNQVGSAVCLI